MTLILVGLLSQSMAAEPETLTIVRAPLGPHVIDEAGKRLRPGQFAELVGDQRRAEHYWKTYRRMKMLTWLGWGGGAVTAYGGLLGTALLMEPVGLAGVGIGLGSFATATTWYFVGRLTLNTYINWYEEDELEQLVYAYNNRQAALSTPGLPLVMNTLPSQAPSLAEGWSSARPGSAVAYPYWSR